MNSRNNNYHYRYAGNCCCVNHAVGSFHSDFLADMNFFGWWADELSWFPEEQWSYPLVNMTSNMTYFSTRLFSAGIIPSGFGSM